MAEEPKASPQGRYLIWYVLAILAGLLIFQYYSVAKQTRRLPTANCAVWWKPRGSTT